MDYYKIAEEPLLAASLFFIEYAQQVKSYVDIDCQATLEDLLKRFNAH